jgi:hypothetical protein
LSAIASAPWTFKPPLGTALARPTPTLGPPQDFTRSKPLFPIFVLPLNEGAGKNVTELSNFRPGTLSSSAVWTTAKDGRAVLMTGTGTDRVTVSGVQKLGTVITTGFTLEVIFTQRVQRNYNGLISRATGGAANPFDLYCSAANIVFNVGDGSSSTASNITLPAAGARTHLCISIGKNTSLSQWRVQSVMNGVQQATGSITASQNIVDAGGDIQIGNRPDSVTPMDGTIAFAAVWSGAMSLGQMQERTSSPWGIFSTAGLYSPGGPSATPPPPVVSGNWRFMQPAMGVFAEYLAATPSRLSSLRVEYPFRAVVLKDGMADTALQWFIANTPPALRWSW